MGSGPHSLNPSHANLISTPHILQKTSNGMVEKSNIQIKYHIDWILFNYLLSSLS